MKSFSKNYQAGRLPMVSSSSWDSYRKGEPQFSLNFNNVLNLVRDRLLVPPLWDELGDRSKINSLSKTIAVAQTLWYIV